jgi:hypothetical protein
MMMSLRIKGIGIVLLMLFLTVSVTCGLDQKNTTDQQQISLTDTINNLEQMRLIMLEKLVAVIPIKENYASEKATASSDCNQVELPNACTYTFKGGQTLAETRDANGYLLTDSFKDNTTHLQLDTEYTIYSRPQCYSLIDGLLQISLKVCYPCANNTTSISWMNQTEMNITTGDTLTWTVNCCGNITKRTYSKVPGRPFAAAAPALMPASALTPASALMPDDPTSITDIEVTGQAEINTPLTG